jgi:hypothetical protein
MWTSDDQHDRDTAVKSCAGCVVIVECGDAADELGEKWHVLAHPHPRSHDDPTQTLITSITK